MLTKSDLISQLAEKEEITKVQAKQLIESIFGILANTLKKKEAVVLPEIGRLSPSFRRERKGHNPQNGKPIIIPASTKLGITACSNMLKELNR